MKTTQLTSAQLEFLCSLFDAADADEPLAYECFENEEKLAKSLKRKGFITLEEDSISTSFFARLTHEAWNWLKDNNHAAGQIEKHEREKHYVSSEIEVNVTTSQNSTLMTPLTPPDIASDLRDARIDINDNHIQVFVNGHSVCSTVFDSNTSIQIKTLD